MTDKPAKTQYEESMTVFVPWGDDRAHGLALEFQKQAATQSVKLVIRRGDAQQPGLRPPGIH